MAWRISPKKDINRSSKICKRNYRHTICNSPSSYHCHDTHLLNCPNYISLMSKIRGRPTQYLQVNSNFAYYAL